MNKVKGLVLVLSAMITLGLGFIAQASASDSVDTILKQSIQRMDRQESNNRAMFNNR
jgi:hypothetical protein